MAWTAGTSFLLLASNASPVSSSMNAGLGAKPPPQPQTKGQLILTGGLALSFHKEGNKTHGKDSNIAHRTHVCALGLQRRAAINITGRRTAARAPKTYRGRSMERQGGSEQRRLGNCRIHHRHRRNPFAHHWHHPRFKGSSPCKPTPINPRFGENHRLVSGILNRFSRRKWTGNSQSCHPLSALLR